MSETGAATGGPKFAPALEQVKPWARDMVDGQTLRAPSDARSIAAWRRKARRQVMTSLGVDPAAAARPEWDVLQTWTHRGLRASRLSVAAPGDLPWEAIVLEPPVAGPNHPAWVCIHGHVFGAMSSTTGLAVNEPGGAESLARFEDDYAFRLAERGHVTIAFHGPGFGNRADPGATPNAPAGSPQDGTLVQAMATGRTYIGWFAANAISAVSVLQAWPTVGRRRVGIVGFRSGAGVALYAGAMDRRIRAVALSGRIGNRQNRLLEGGATGLHATVPGLLRYVDNTDALGLIAPRLLFVNQEVRNDADAALAALSPARRLYEALGAGKRFSVHVDAPNPPRHRFGGEAMYRWAEQVMPVPRKR